MTGIDQGQQTLNFDGNDKGGYDSGALGEVEPSELEGSNRPMAMAPGM